MGVLTDNVRRIMELKDTELKNLRTQVATVKDQLEQLGQIFNGECLLNKNLRARLTAQSSKLESMTIDRDARVEEIVEVLRPRLVEAEGIIASVSACLKGNPSWLCTRCREKIEAFLTPATNKPEAPDPESIINRKLPEGVIQVWPFDRLQEAEDAPGPDNPDPGDTPRPKMVLVRRDVLKECLCYLPVDLEDYLKAALGEKP